MCVDANDNELAYLESIHFFVEVLDSFFGNVCELDLVFNFYKVGDLPLPPLETKKKTTETIETEKILCEARVADPPFLWFRII